MTSPTPSQHAAAAIAVARAIGEAIRDGGPIPSGHLYAMLQDRISLNAFQTVVSILVEGGLIKSEHHLLTWIGPR